MLSRFRVFYYYLFLTAEYYRKNVGKVRVIPISAIKKNEVAQNIRKFQKT